MKGNWKKIGFFILILLLMWGAYTFGAVRHYKFGRSDGFYIGGEIAMESCLTYLCGEDTEECNMEEFDEARIVCDNHCFSGEIYGE